MSIQLAPRALQLWNNARPERAGLLVDYAQATGPASLTLYGVVGEDFTDRSVADALARLEAAGSLTLYVNSPGGDYFQGKAIHSQVARFAAKVPTVAHVDSLAASAASLLIMAAPRVELAPEASIMIHEVQALAFGRASDLESMAALIRAENTALASIYARRTGLEVDAVAQLLAAETWFTAQEAVAIKLADAVAMPPDPCMTPGEMTPGEMEKRHQAQADEDLRAIADLHARVSRAFTGRE